MQIQPKTKNDKLENKYIGIAFVVFFYLICRNLDNASIWLDEGVEYWFSKSIHAILPGESVISTMYERIMRTYQPPLYNVLMYFWLKICDTEIWFRLLGVIFGFGSGVAIFKTTKELTNYKVGIISILILANIYNFVYYIQECAEYNLMLFNLSWSFYWFVISIKKMSKKSVALFILFAILSVYSQYGAAFFVIAYAVALLVYTIYKKDIQYIKFIIVSYLGASCCFGLPLYFFFAKRQIEHNISSNDYSDVVRDKNWIASFARSLKDVVDQNFVSYNDTVVKWGVYFTIIIVIVATIILIVKNKDVVVIYMLFGLCIEYLIYYFFVQANIYGYGYFKNRYCLFLLPTIFIYIITTVFRLCVLNYETERVSKFNINYRDILIGILIGITVIYIIEGYQLVRSGWEKENNKGMLKAWYKETPIDCETLVYYGAVPAFSFYIEHEENYIPESILNLNKRNLIYQEEIRNKTIEEYSEYLNQIYDNNLPDDIYFLCSHYIDDLDDMLLGFNSLGYNDKVIWEDTQAKIIHLNK